nr:MAG TPA: hypothetical protein [Bacteriophage sp.]
MYNVYKAQNNQNTKLQQISYKRSMLTYKAQ